MRVLIGEVKDISEMDKTKTMSRKEFYKETVLELGIMLATGVIGAFTLLGIVTYF